MRSHLFSAYVTVYVGLYVVFLVNVNLQSEAVLSVCTGLRHSPIYLRQYSCGPCLSWQCLRGAGFRLQALLPADKSSWKL
jgi:hypothetical protein